jgi:hypothetical protein
MGENVEALMGKFQEHVVKENAKETIGNLLKHSTRPGNLTQKARIY